MFVRIHKSYRNIVAICDSEILGKKFEEGKLQIEVKENFFGTEKHSEEEIKKIIRDMSREDATFNIIGKRSVNLALKENLISEEDIKKIQNIPFTMVLF
jgi:uncharacterized protein